MLSNQGPQFAAKAFCELLKLLGIKSNLTTAYHPQTDGATERVNQEIKAYLSIYCSAHPTEWKNSLSMLEFTHNNQQHADQIHTSFKLMNGKAPIAIPMTFKNTKFPSVAKKNQKPGHK
jgi:transposase InsO family protein